LAKAVAGIRPKVAFLLKHGVPDRFLRAALAVMRALYRLSALTIEGSQAFKIMALINPGEPVFDGISDDQGHKLLAFIHELGAAIKKYVQSKAKPDPNKTEAVVEAGAGPAETQAQLESVAPAKAWGRQRPSTRRERAAR